MSKKSIVEQTKKAIAGYNQVASNEDLAKLSSITIAMLGMMPEEHFTLDSIAKLDDYIDQYCPKGEDRQYTFVTFGVYIATTLVLALKEYDCQVKRDKYGSVMLLVKGKTKKDESCSVFTTDWCYSRQKNGNEDNLCAKAKATVTIIKQNIHGSAVIVNDDGTYCTVNIKK